jgi:pSer/pThr/pTyr-binding forkhead associated (FHA) protein
MAATLNVMNGAREGDSIELTRLGSYTIGRVRDCEIRIRDRGISRQHCRIDFDGDHYWLVDLKSQNGTVLNGRRINRSLLYNGDVFTVGHVKLEFSRPEESEGN